MAATNQTHKRQTPLMDEEVDYYKLLNVPYSATYQEITRAYREAMKRAHPDRAHPERRAAAEERAKLINLAFNTLSKAESRRDYDSKIRASAVQSQIMSHYFGGRVPGHEVDPFGAGLRREKTRAERAEQRRSDRTAVASILIVFGGITAIVIALLLLWAAIQALVALLA